MFAKDRVSQINCIVFKKENGEYKFLVLKRREDRGGFWQSVTGGVREKESEISALKRELKEETGIGEYQKIINLKYSFSFSLPHLGELVENVYAVEVGPDTEIVFSPEHTEYRWVDFKEALSLLKYDTSKEGFRKLWKILGR
ncbi:MAG: NUDIX domain-containing protein [bacterium]|nr:NUDIX domain-containing protein [bacterium]